MRILRSYSTSARILLVLFAATFFTASNSYPQSSATYEKDRVRAVQLITKGDYEKALPILGKLAAAKKSDRPVMYGLGIALLIDATKTRKPVVRKETLIRARNALLEAKRLGEDGEFINDVLRRIPLDGNDIGSEAEKLALLISLHPPYVFDQKPKDGIRLLDGYKFRSGGNFEGSGGEIYNDGGLRIVYEFGFSQGFAADKSEKDRFAWYRETTVNGRKVMLALVKPGLRTQFEPDNPRSPELGNILIVTFDMGGDVPNNTKIATNFYAEVLNSGEVADALLMILTYDPK